MNTPITRCAKSLAVLIVLGGAYAPAFATEGAPALPLSLEECVSRALEHNLDIAVQSIGCQIAEENVIGEMAGFNPSLGLDLSVNRDRKPTASVLEGGAGRTEVAEKRLVWDTSLTQPLPIGGSLALHFGNNRFETDSEYQTINPVYRSSVSLVWTQPLLNRFGVRVSRADAAIAQHDKERLRSLFRGFVAAIIVETCSRYWDLVYARGDLEAKRTAYRQAAQIGEMTEADMDQGRRPITDVLKARAEVSARKGKVVGAEAAVKNAEDQLKLITNLLEDATAWQRPLVPTSELDRAPGLIDEAGCLEEARAHRPEYKAAQSEYNALKVRTALARNALLPSVDLVGQMALSGVGAQYADNISQLRTSDFNGWGVGLRMQFPLGNRAARSVFRQRSLEQKRMEVSMRILEHRITAEVRRAARHIHTCAEQVDAAEQVDKFREMDLDATLERFRLGMTTSDKALEAQQDLAEARSEYVGALVAYNNALIQLEEVKGTLIGKYSAP